MNLKISINDANPDELARGLLAAQTIFDRTGVTPQRAAEARFSVEGWDLSGYDSEVSADDLDICHLWDEADEAAVRACCADWDEVKKPTTAKLALVDLPDLSLRFPAGGKAVEEIAKDLAHEHAPGPSTFAPTRSTRPWWPAMTPSESAG
jgi:hypothetical protein